MPFGAGPVRIAHPRAERLASAPSASRIREPSGLAGIGVEICNLVPVLSVSRIRGPSGLAGRGVETCESGARPCPHHPRAVRPGREGRRDMRIGAVAVRVARAWPRRLRLIISGRHGRRIEWSAQLEGPHLSPRPAFPNIPVC